MKVVVGDTQAFERVLKRLGVLVGPLLGGQAAFGRRVDHLGRVLVRPGQKKHIVADHTVVPRHDVRDGRRIDVADVRPIVDVVDRRRDVEFLCS